MTDAVIAAIGRRLAVAAAVNGYERKPDTQKDFLITLRELCDAVKEERAENAQQLPQQ